MHMHNKICKSVAWIRLSLRIMYSYIVFNPDTLQILHHTCMQFIDNNAILIKFANHFILSYNMCARAHMHERTQLYAHALRTRANSY